MEEKTKQNTDGFTGYTYETDTSLFDSHGGLTPYGWQRIIMTVSERELKRLGLDIPSLEEKYGISWVLMSFSVKIHKPVSPGACLRVSTRHTWRKGVLYRRDFEICGEDGERIAVAATFSSLFDIAKRHIVLDRHIYEEVSLPEKSELFEAESKSAVNGDFTKTEEVAVRPCWIDALGHVNNFRYGELVFDTIPKEYAGRLDGLKRLEIFFTGELRLGEKAVLEYASSELTGGGRLLQVAGIHSDTEKPAFLAKLYF